MVKRVFNIIMILLLFVPLYGCMSTNSPTSDESNHNDSVSGVGKQEPSLENENHDYLFAAMCNADIIVSGVQDDYGLDQYLEDINKYSRDDFDYYTYSKIGILRKGDKFFVYDEYDYGDEKWYKIGKYAWIKCEISKNDIEKINSKDINSVQADLFFTKLPASGTELYSNGYYNGTFTPEDQCDFILSLDTNLIFTKKNNFTNQINKEFRNTPSLASLPNFPYSYDSGTRNPDGSYDYVLENKNITDVEYDELGRVSSFKSCDNIPWGSREVDQVLEVEYNGNIAFMSVFVKSELYGDAYYYYTCRMNSNGLIIEEYNKGLFSCDVLFNYE